MSDMDGFLEYPVRYGEEEEKPQTKPHLVRVFRTRIDGLSTKLIGYQDNLSARFAPVLDEKPTEDRFTRKLTDQSVRWSCVHETMELLTLAITALAAIKSSVAQDTLPDYKIIVTCLDETASEQYSTLMLAEKKGLWRELYEKVCARFTNLQAWANSSPKMYKHINATAGVGGLFMGGGGGLVALLDYLFPGRFCEMDGAVSVIGAMMAMVVGGCVLGIAYVMHQEKKRNNAFNGALLEMIQNLNKEMKHAPDLSEVQKLLQTTREQATVKWGGLLSEEQKRELLRNLGECSICLSALLVDTEDIVVPITNDEDCRRKHVFHASCLPENGRCPLCRRHYLKVSAVPPGAGAMAGSVPTMLTAWIQARLKMGFLRGATKSLCLAYLVWLLASARQRRTLWDLYRRK